MATFREDVHAALVHAAHRDPAIKYVQCEIKEGPSYAELKIVACVHDRSHALSVRERSQRLHSVNHTSTRDITRTLRNSGYVNISTLKGIKSLFRNAATVGAEITISLKKRAANA